MLRVWLARRCDQLPGSRRVESFCEQVIQARRDRAPVLAWQHGEVRCYRQQLYYLPPGNVARRASARRSYPVRGDETLVPPLGRLQLVKGSDSGIAARLLDGGAVTVRFRRGGERLRLPRRPNKPLKHLMQEWGMPPWERQVWPLVYLDETLIAVPGYGSAAACLAKPGEPAVNFFWKPFDGNDGV